MNNDKLNIQFLIDSVASKTGNTKKDSEIHIKEFVRILKESLLKDNIVKIKGLGTFKLTWNKSRKSVNVQTGEEIEIAGHYKIDFIPENSLKEFANEPYAHLENTILDLDENSIQQEKSQNEEIEKLQKLSIQAIEIKSLLSDINNNIGEIPQSSETVRQEQHTDNEQVNFTETAEESKQDSTNEFEQKEDSTISQENQEETCIPQKKKNKGCWWFVLLLILLLGVLAYFLRPYFFNNPKPGTNDIINADSTILNLKDSIECISSDTIFIESDSIENEITEKANFCDETFPDFDIDNCEILAEVEVTAGARLAWYSTKYYGDHSFWPYIYAANSDIMSSPNDLEKGIIIKIPKLPQEMIDPANETAVQWCKECLNQQ